MSANSPRPDDTRHEHAALPPAVPETLDAELLASAPRYATDFGLPSLDGVGVRADCADDAVAEDTEAPEGKARGELAPSLLVPQPRLAAAPATEPVAPSVTDEEQLGPRRKSRAAVEHTEPVTADSGAELDARWSDLAVDVTAIDRDEPQTETPDDARPDDGDSVGENEPANDEPVWEPSYAVSASEARYEQPSAIGLLHPKYKTPPADERNDTLGAFAALDEGETAVVRISLRADPDAQDEHRDWVEAVKRGETPKRPSKALKAATKAGKVTLKAARWLYRVANKNAGATAPTTPLPPPALAEETKHQVEAAEHKHSSGLTVYETTLRVAVVGKPGDETDLAAKRHAIEVELHDVGQGYARQQRLAWSECDGYDAVAGVLAPRRDRTPTALRMSAAELAAFAPPYDDRTDPGGVKVTRAAMKPLEPANPHPIADPFNPPPGQVPLGIVNPGSDDAYVHAIDEKLLDRHGIFVGRTGAGKSVLLEWVVNALVRVKHKGVVVIDPLGNLGNNLLVMLAQFCPERLDDVVMVDLLGTPEELRGHEGLADSFSVAFNPLDVESAEEIGARQGSLASILLTHAKLNPDSTPRALNYVTAALTALMYANLELSDENKLTMLDVPQFLDNPVFRELVVQRCPVASVQEIFGDDGTWNQLSDKDKLEHAGPVRRAFQSFAGNASFEAFLASPTNKLNFASLIKQRKIVIIKLADGDDAVKKLSQFIGQMLIPSMMSSRREWGRKIDPVTGDKSPDGAYLIVDEAPIMVGRSNSGIKDALAQWRQSGACFLGFAQYWNQFDPDVTEGFKANTGTKLSFKQHAKGAGDLAEEMCGGDGTLTRTDITNLPEYHAYAVANDSGPFAVAGLKPMLELAREQGRELLDHDEVQAARAAAYRRSWATIGNPTDAIAARRTPRMLEVNWPTKQDPDATRNVATTQGVLDTIEELTGNFQRRIDAGLPVSVADEMREPPQPIVEQNGPTPTAPNATAAAPGTLDPAQTEAFNPKSSLYANEDPSSALFDALTQRDQESGS